MSGKTITVELTEAEAQEISGLRRGILPDVLLEKVRNALSHEYPEGTIAWITTKSNLTHLAFREDGKWRSQKGSGFIQYDSGVVKVEPIRTLADHEIAVKHIFGGFASTFRAIADNMQDKSLGHGYASEVLRAYADALEAEQA